LIQVKYSEKAEGEAARSREFIASAPKVGRSQKARFSKGQTPFFATPQIFAARKSRCSAHPFATEVNGKNRPHLRPGNEPAG
jgi:hypothetical protein